ncbi:MAG TPA: thioredoxin domain-containing protein [Thermoanaerobaculia bacterium]|nr:thioredoxin domain-containing protein [Thermoanaerobaculia bacterium]
MNRLAQETSPYLLQHAHNPVDWYPWGPEAFARARDEDRPIFLSIGYSACHWCHVMERESFEDERVAALLNESFVSIKVDREERPDVDSIYMQAVQMMTGHGGWPMSMFLTPEGAPFFGGTYFPPEDRHGLPSFSLVLRQIAAAWRDRRGDVTTASEELRRALVESSVPPSQKGNLTRDALTAAANSLAAGFDPEFGGFGSAPKFPPSMSLDFVMQVAARTGDPRLRQVVTHTLDQMGAGGIYDQIGGGFHRYSVDAKWLVPHFEKMLYDNALLARLYVRGWQWTKEPRYARIARETLDFIAREMRSPEGGFYSTLDADSEGVEGKFYVWTRAEILKALGHEDGEIVARLFDASDEGNWEGHSILNLPREPEVVARELGMEPEVLLEIVTRARPTLLAARERRVRPGRDEKILAGWNGWMLAAFSEAALAFDSDHYREIATANADFLLSRLRPEGRLLRSWKDGVGRIDALLEDFAGVAWGLIASFEATQRRSDLDAALELAREMIERFGDAEGGGFWDTPHDGEPLITRPRDLFDNATPSGNSLAAATLLRLGAYFDDRELEAEGKKVVEAMAGTVMRVPSAFGFLLSQAAEWIAGPPTEIAVTGSWEDVDVRSFWQVIGESYLPNRILASSTAAPLPLVEGKPLDRAAVWICERYSCQEPISDPEQLRSALP